MMFSLSQIGEEMIIRKLSGDRTGIVYAFAKQSLRVENQFAVSKLQASISLDENSTCWMANRLYVMGEG